ncbi:MAG TPA: DUF4249 family protein [Chryseosolibacter sp.]
MKPIRFKLWLLLATLFACEERTDIDVKATTTDLIAVEGVMTNENRNHTVRLTRPYLRQNGTSSFVTGASVFVSDGFSSVSLTAGDSGKYLTPAMRFVSGRTYTLTILYNGRQFTAQDSSVPVESLGPLSYTPVEGGYRINFFETGSQPNYINYDIIWAGTASCAGACKAKVVYYDLKSVDANALFKPEKTDFIFPSRSTVIRRKFSVSDRYRAYLRSMLSETEWRGSVFDVQRDNAPTNFTPGAIGFFAVSTVVSDTLKIQ